MNLRLLRPLCGLALAFFVLGCGDSPTDPNDTRGLKPGTYTLVFEVFATVLTPDIVEGKHNLSFRVSEPALSPSDVALVSSLRSPVGSAVERDHLVVSPDLEVSPTRWTLRFVNTTGEYTVALTMGDRGDGGYAVIGGCFVRLTGGASFQGSGCVIDKI